MQPASKPAGELARMRGERDKCVERTATSASDDWVCRYHSGSSCKLGKYPSELNWSSLGDVLGFIYVTGMRTDQAMLRVATNGK